jgi:hypothetical protein
MACIMWKVALHQCSWWLPPHPALQLLQIMLSLVHTGVRRDRRQDIRADAPVQRHAAAGHAA